MENENADTTPSVDTDIADVSVPKSHPIAEDSESAGHDATSTMRTSKSETTPTTTPVPPAPAPTVPTPQKTVP